MTNKELKSLIGEIAAFINRTHTRCFEFPFPTTIKATDIASAIDNGTPLIIPLQAVGAWIPFRELQVKFTKNADERGNFITAKIEIYNEENGVLQLFKQAERDFITKDTK